VAHSKHLERIALSWELAEIVDALEAARVLGEAVATCQLGTDYDREHAPRSLVAMLSLTWVRLRDVLRAVRGDLDPSHLRAPHNDVTRFGAMKGELLLNAWRSSRGPARRLRR